MTAGPLVAGLDADGVQERQLLHSILGKECSDLSTVEGNGEKLAHQLRWRLSSSCSFMRAATAAY